MTSLSGYRQDRVYNTRCFVTVYRHGAEPIQLVGEQTLRPRQGGPAALVSCSHEKRLGDPSGTFAIGLREGSLDIRREIRAGDWVVIHWTRNGEKLPGMLGVIERVSRSRRSVDGALAEEWQIQGRDFGRIFQITSIWFDDYTNYQNNAGGQILGARMGFVPGGAPNQVVNRIVEAWLGQGDPGRGIVGGSWRWPSGLEYLGEYFAEGLRSVVGQGDPLPLGVTAQPVTAFGFADTGTINLRGESFDEASLFSPNEGTFLWDLMTEWSNPMLNELFADQIVDGGSNPEQPVPALFHRERPFVNVDEGQDSPWFKVRTHRLPFDAFFTTDVSTNDAERLNLFMLYATQSGVSNFDQYVAYPPSYDRDDLARHGLRKWEKKTPFNSVQNGNASWVYEIATWHRLVTSWYGPNHEWLSGSSLVPALLPEIRIGDRLVVGENSEEDPEQYYVEGVSVQWSYTKKGTTTMQLTRGFRGKDNELVELVSDTVARFSRRTVQGVAGLENVSTEDLQKFAANLSGQDDVFKR